MRITAEPIGETTPEQDLEQIKFMDDLNGLIESGEITAQEDADGVVRLYPV